MSQGQERISKEKKRYLLKRLKAEIGPEKSSLYKGAVLSWLQFLMRVISFYLISQAIYKLYLGQQISIMPFILAMTVLSLSGYLFSMLARRYQGLASQYARNQLKKRFFTTFEANSGEFDERFTMADLMTVASQGIDSLDTYYHYYLSIALRVYLNCTSVLLLVTFIFPLGGLIFLLSLPLIPISIVAMQKRSKQIMNHYWATYMDVGNLFVDNLRGLNTLYTYGATETYEKTFAQKAEEFRQSTMSLLRFQLEAVGYMDGVMYLGVGISGFFAVLALSKGQLTLAGMVFFLLIAAEFFAPIREMGYGMHLVMMNTKMADRIYTFLDSVNSPEVSSHYHASEEIGDVNTIKLNDLTFGYGDATLFNHLSAVIRKGQMFAIAGESGLGKTTLAKLLKGRLQVDSGSITLDERPISSFSLKSLEENIVLVSPESYLFNQSIYDNLILGQKCSKSEVLSWLDRYHLLSFITDLPEGLDTIVGENGALLSPGQRQQIILARALLAKRPVYIFDEMTSSVDGENEIVLFNAIKEISSEAIVIFISHKMKQVLKADQVIFLDQNHQVHIGNPNDLLTTNQAFATLVNTQKELEELLHES